MSYLTQANKFLAALAGVIAQVVAANVVSGTALHYVQVAAAVVAALLVFAVPNTPAPAPKPAPPAVPPKAAPAP